MIVDTAQRRWRRGLAVFASLRWLAVVVSIAFGPAVLQVWHERMASEAAMSCAASAHGCDEGTSHDERSEHPEHDSGRCATCVHLFFAQHAIDTGGALEPPAVGLVEMVAWPRPVSMVRSRWRASAVPRGPPTIG